MYWVHVYAWLSVSIKAIGAGVRGVLSWSLDDSTRDFVMCWLRVYVRLRVKINSKVSGVQGGILNTFRDHTLKLVARRSHA